MQKSTWQTPDGLVVEVLDPETSSETPDWAGSWQPGQVVCIIGVGTPEPTRMILDRPDPSWTMLAGESDFEPKPEPEPAPQGVTTHTVSENATSTTGASAKVSPAPSDFDSIEALMAQLGIDKKPSKPADMLKLGCEHLGGGVYAVTAGNAPRKQVRGKDAAILLALQRIVMATRGG